MRSDLLRSCRLDTLLVAVATLAAACGGSEKKEQFTCDVQTASVNTCTVAQVDSSKVGAFMTACTSLGGTITTDPCSRPNPLGICNDEKGDGFTANVTSYPSSTISTPAGAQTACDNEGGTWVANADFAPGYQCASATYCAQFGALTTSQQSLASGYCQQFGLPAVSTGVCSTASIVGTCMVSNANTGPVTVYFYSGDSGSDQAGCEQQLGGTWTSAT